MKYLKKRVTRRHKKTCRRGSKSRIRSKRCRTTRRRYVMKGG